MTKSILAALVCGTIGLASPGGTDVAPERVVITREVVVTHRVARAAHVATAPAEPPH